MARKHGKLPTAREVRGILAPRIRETDIHRAVAAFLDIALPADAYWTTIGHGWGKMNKATAGIAKACGVKRGVPDVMIIYRERAHFIELKTVRGKVSPFQIDAMKRIRGAGGRTWICRSIDGVAFALDQWVIPMRARIAA